MEAGNDPMLTPEQLVERWNNKIMVDTLKTWRYLDKGPKYVKIEKAIMYRLSDVLAYEHANTMGGAQDAT